MFGTEASLPITVKEVGAVVRRFLLMLRLHRCPCFDRTLFWTFSWKLADIFRVLESPDVSPDGFTHNHYLAKRDVERITGTFNIDCPEIDADTVRIWLHYMALLIDSCKDGNLKVARNIMRDPNLRFRSDD